jgi:hypothetical protein
MYYLGGEEGGKEPALCAGKNFVIFGIKMNI